jgi:hypothetical protein
MARPRVGTDGFVYFIRADEVNRVKIGFSTRPEERMGSLKTGSPCSLTLLGSVPGNQITDLHARKYWRLPDEPAGVRVTIHELASEPVEEASTNV